MQNEVNPCARLARMLKPQRQAIGAVTGKVICVSPLQVRIGDNIIAKHPKLYKPPGLSLEAGERVLVIAAADNQTFYIVGRTEAV